MRKEGFVSAAVVAAQYGISRSQLLELVLEGRVTPAKPSGSSSFFVRWADMLRELGKPADFRKNPTLAAVVEPEDLIVLDGMLDDSELEESLEADASRASDARKAKQQTPAPPQQSIVIRPSDFTKE
jgi:hypothetical protein